MISHEYINELLFNDIKKALDKDGYGVGSTHPFWILLNYKDEIIKSVLIKEKIEKYYKLFPDNQLLKELLS